VSAPEILFVCWGNICRSPMAEVVAKEWARRDRVSGVAFTSAGVSNEEAGNPMDPRAVATLKASGYHPAPHTARLVTAAEIESAAMVIGMERTHLRRIRQLVPDAGALYLLTDFDPDSVPGTEIDDPWYGDDSDFIVALKQIEAAMPGLMKRAQQLHARSA
jgi:protein-tyrosine phosphatase